MGLFFHPVQKMELTHEYFRAIILHNFQCGLSIQDCIDTLNYFYGKEAPSYSSMKNWYKRFQRGPVSFQDEFHEGHPRSIVMPQNIDVVRELLVQEYHATYREIEAFLDFTVTNINKIFHEHLAVKTIYSRWIPHIFSNA